MNKVTKFLPLILGVVAGVGVILGMRLQQTLGTDSMVEVIKPTPETSIKEALNHIKSKFYGDLDYIKFSDKVLSDMVEELDDYSHYFPAAKDADYNRYIKGLYEGIGIEYAAFQDTVYITSVIPDSPADQYSIERGDVLLRIDDIDIYDINLDSVRFLISQDVGDSIDISIYHHQDDKIGVYRIVVDNVSVPLVKSYVFGNKPDVAYIRISRFYKGVFRDFMDELDHFQRDSIDIKDLIIDLRGNLGGVVDETIKLLNQFFKDKDLTLLSTINNVDDTQIYKSNGRNFLDIDRIVVVIDERSASASEILAAVLQDYDRAVIMGANSFGKGVIQQNYSLSNNGSLNLTVGAYILPSGRKINKVLTDTLFYTLRNRRLLKDGKGVNPDRMVERCSKSQFQHRRKALNKLVENKLWSQQSLLEYIDKQSWDESSQDSCSRAKWSDLRWNMMDIILAGRSEIYPKDLDLVLQAAYEVIVSDEYETLLENK